MGRVKPLPHFISGPDECCLAWLWRRLTSNGRLSKSWCNGFHDTVNPHYDEMVCLGWNIHFHESKPCTSGSPLGHISRTSWRYDLRKVGFPSEKSDFINVSTRLNSWLCNDTDWETWTSLPCPHHLSTAAYIYVICYGNEKWLYFVKWERKPTRCNS